MRLLNALELEAFGVRREGECLQGGLRTGGAQRDPTRLAGTPQVGLALGQLKDTVGYPS